MVITTILLLAVFIFFSAIYGLIGAKRGVIRQSIRAAMMILSFVCALYSAKLCTDAAMALINRQNASDVLAMIDKLKIPVANFRDLISYIDPKELDYVIATPVAIFVSPILAFPLFFILFQLLMLIPYFVICFSAGLIKKGVRGKKNKKKHPLYSRVTGLLIGTVQGVIMLAIIMSPISGVLTRSTEVVEQMEEEAPDMPTTQTISKGYNSWIKPWAESPVIKSISKLGGSELYKTLSTVKINGKDSPMFETFADPSIKVAITIHDVWGMQWDNPTPEEEDAIRALIDVLTNNEDASGLIVTVIRFVSDAHKGGAINLDNIEGDLGEIVLTVFETIDTIKSPETLKSYVLTFADVYFLLADNGALTALKDGDEDAIVETLTQTIGEGENETTVIKAAVGMLNSNEQTEPLVTAVTKLTISAIVTDTLPDGAGEVYENIKNGAGEILEIKKEEGKEEEYKAEVSEKLNTVLNENNIEVEEEILDEMAGYISDNYDDLQKKLEENNNDLDGVANDIILSYYDAYIKYMASQNQTPDTPDLPDAPVVPNEESNE